MILLQRFALGFIATFGFSHFFKAPKNIIFKNSCVGGLGLVVFSTLQFVMQSPLVNTLVASLVVSLFGEFLARKLHIPATTVIYPSITPLVPGAGMYYTMYNLVNKDFMSFIATGTETFMIASGLALGIITSSVITKIIIAPRP
ncbi:MAG: threonine/serine exporter [Tissierellia bacterium]|nr:threonine/serine exporter [Tissierellia bacterium]